MSIAEKFIDSNKRYPHMMNGFGGQVVHTEDALIAVEIARVESAITTLGDLLADIPTLIMNDKYLEARAFLREERVRLKMKHHIE